MGLLVVATMSMTFTFVVSIQLSCDSSVYEFAAKALVKSTNNIVSHLQELYILAAIMCIPR